MELAKDISLHTIHLFRYDYGHPFGMTAPKCPSFSKAAAEEFSSVAAEFFALLKIF